MVDNLTIPGFEVDNGSGLDFGLCKLTHGSSSAIQSSMNDDDFYLTVTVKVKRDSGELARMLYRFAIPFSSLLVRPVFILRKHTRRISIEFRPIMTRNEYEYLDLNRLL
jgi:hypothetical protein